jgi:hypothetical protein
MNESDAQLDEKVTISVERMMRFCYLAQMEFEYAPYGTSILPIHLSRFGTMVFEAASFLYSLFEDTENSINLLAIWQGFNHPFDNELQKFVKKLEPFKDELRLVRNRVGFHGSLNRSRERAGLGIFDVESPRAREFARLVRDMQNLSLKMVKWYIDRMNKAARPSEMWQEFMVELQSHPLIQCSKGKSGADSN